jgi:hypothetical protein
VFTKIAIVREAGGTTTELIKSENINGISGASATSVPNQFGVTNPNNPNYTYTSSYSDTSYAVALGVNSWKGVADYKVGSAKKNNKLVDDTRSTQVRTTTAPQSAETNFYSDVDDVTGIYPYFFGKVPNGTTLTNSLIASIIAGTANPSFIANKIVEDAGEDITITFNASGEIVWFAHAASYSSKTIWTGTSPNTGKISSTSWISLLSEPYNVTSPQGYWSSVPFKIYIANWATTTEGSITFKVS